MKNNNWKKKELGEIIEIKKEKYNPIKEQVDYPCIELEHINQNIGSINGYTRAKLQSSIKNKFYKGDVLYGKLRPYLRKYHFAKFEGVCSSEIWVLNGKDIKNEYLFYLVQDERFNNIANVSTGSKMPRADWTFMERYPFNIPPKEEQDRIVEILSTWDLAIEKQEQLIEKKKEFKKGLMQRLLSGEVRFNKENGQSFPEWRKVKLGKYLIKHNEKSEFNNQYPVLTSSRKGIFLQSDYYAGNDVASDDTTGYNVVPRGYFTYRHMSDDLIFKFNINDIVDKGIVSTLYPVFTVKNMDSYFLRAKLNEGDEFKRFALAQKQGGSRTYMYFSKLESLQMNIPSLEEQEKISEVLKLADKEIELLEKELEALKLQKKGLMQRLLTGEVRVKV